MGKYKKQKKSVKKYFYNAQHWSGLCATHSNQKFTFLKDINVIEEPQRNNKNDLKKYEYFLNNAMTKDHLITYLEYRNID